MNNLGQAVLVVGTIYLHLVHGLDATITFILCIIGLALIVSPSMESKKLRDQLTIAQTKLANAKADYYSEKHQ